MEDGDLALGALMMVHARENESLICGEVMPQGGVQAVEAMLYTLDWINANDIIPYTKLGARILDDCDKDTYGLQQAVDFIKGIHTTCLVINKAICQPLLSLALYLFICVYAKYGFLYSALSYAQWNQMFHFYLQKIS